MFSQLFENYLLNRGLVNPEQLREALDYQNSTHLKFGVLAINAGHMSSKQVGEVHEKQKQVDKKFGELAIEMNYITKKQLEELLSTQKTGHLLLGQALIDKNYLTLEELQIALDEYKKDYSLDNKQFKALQHDDINTIIDVLVRLKESSYSSIYKDYLVLFIKNMIRFLDESPVAGECFVTEHINTGWYVRQDMYGELDLTTAISASEEVFLQIASKYAGEYFTQITELAKSSVAEFLNLHNGIFLVNMSDEGMDIELRPQTVANGLTTPIGISKGLVIPFNISSSSFNLIMAPA